MALTPEEKAAGRLFRAVAEARRAEFLGEGFIWIPATLAFVRHDCTRGIAALGRTKSLNVREHYLLSPTMAVCGTCGAVGAFSRACTGLRWACACQGEHTEIPAGRFAYLFRAGRCKCGYAAASDGGRVVDRHERPPLRGARELPLEPPG